MDLSSLPAWFGRAACFGMPARLGHDPWFDGSPRAAVPPEAAAVCAGCPVREACAGYAIEHRVAEGVWGGLTPTERAAIRKAA